MAKGGAVKVERSRARGHVASNTLTALTAAIRWPPPNCPTHSPTNCATDPTTVIVASVTSGRDNPRRLSQISPKRSDCGLLMGRAVFLQLRRMSPFLMERVRQL